MYELVEALCRELAVPFRMLVHVGKCFASCWVYVCVLSSQDLFEDAILILSLFRNLLVS